MVERHPYVIVAAADPAFGPLRTLGIVPVGHDGSVDPDRVVPLPILGASPEATEVFLAAAVRIQVVSGRTNGSAPVDAVARRLWAHPPAHTEATDIFFSEWGRAEMWSDRITMLRGPAETRWAVPVAPPQAIACAGREDRWGVAQEFQSPQGRTWAVWTGDEWTPAELQSYARRMYVSTFPRARDRAVSLADQQGWDETAHHPAWQTPIRWTPPELADRLDPSGVLSASRAIPAWSKSLGIDPQAPAPWGGIARAASLGQPGWIAWRTNPDQSFSVLGRRDPDGFGVLIVEHPDSLSRAAVRLGVPLRHEPDVPEPLIAALRPRLERITPATRPARSISF
jgi:hypothetical protein